MQPVTRYAKSADVHIAYQVFGEGPVNLILAPPFVSNIENYWTFRIWSGGCFVWQALRGW